MPWLIDRTWESSGVWLLGEDSLLTLDGIIQKYSQQLERKRKKRQSESVSRKRAELKEAIPEDDQAVGDRLTEYKYRITENFKSTIAIGVENKWIIVPSLKEALTDEKLREFKPNRFEVNIESGSDRINIELGEGFTASTISVNVVPRDLFHGSVSFDLTKWAESTRLPAFWSYWARYAFGLNAILVMLSLVYGFAASIKGESEPKRQMRHEAAKLVENGLNDKTLPKAVQLLLEKDFDVGRPAQTEEGTVTTFAARIGMAIIALMVALVWTYPRSVLAIGRGKASMWRQEWWIWLLHKGLWATVVLGTLSAIIKHVAIRAIFHQQ
jgi:hypothetical protein